ncbi:MAG: YraN family protein [Candidatus Omnitrophica bacterium]|nr:YraN family protein [Candidatus Omnitrophota bacterium]
MNKVELGKKGEAAAVKLLEQSGYRILGRNVRTKFGEIDLVAKEGETLCFVEIKARTGLKFGWPEEAVNSKKRWQLGRLASWYLQSRRLESVPVRFDVVSILLGPDGLPARTRLIKSAFDV